MILSMTGFGRCVSEVGNKTITIDVKSLNSKQTDIICKMPSLYREKEADLRNELTKKLMRGKIDVSIYYDLNEEETSTVLNEHVIKDYFAKLQNLAGELKIEAGEDILQAILRLPDAVKAKKEEFNEKEWKMILECVSNAINKCLSFRKQEGIALEKDIVERTDKILDLLEQVKNFETVRIDNIKLRIRDNLKELIEKNGFDENRFEQELLFYLEKIDITEEKVRLKNHCDYFLETIKLEPPVGKKLGFISQEMGREINTIGSKANDSDIQKLVVQMKDELEKIKEQLMNVL